jgi:hypothetical protein
VIQSKKLYNRLKEKTSLKVATKEASKAHAAQAKTLRTINAKDGEYIGSYVKGDLAGKKVSNKSYMQYYKGMIDV